MTTRHVAALAVVLATLLAGCAIDDIGGAPGAAATTCPNLRSEWLALAVPSEDRTPGWLSGEQVALEADRDTIASYGAEHPDEFAGVWLDNEPAVRLVAAFTGDLESHCAALRDLVAHPERLEVVGRRHTVDDRARIRAEIESQMTPDGAIVGVGDGADHVSVSLRADGAALAAQLVERYGDLVQVDVGGAPYPPSEPPADAAIRCPRPDVGDWPPGVSAELELADDAIRSGGDTRGTVTITNGSDQRFTQSAGDPLTAIVVAPGETTPVGMFAGVVAGVGRDINLRPGEQMTIAVLVGTAACAPTGGDAVPPGRYEARAVIADGPGAALLSEPAPLRIVDG